MENKKQEFLNRYPGSYHIGVRGPDEEYLELQESGKILHGADRRELLFEDPESHLKSCMVNPDANPLEVLRGMSRARSVTGKGGELPLSELQFQCGEANCEGMRNHLPLPVGVHPTVIHPSGMPGH